MKTKRSYKLKMSTPTEILKSKIEVLQMLNSRINTENDVLKAQNVLYKEFFALHFKQGVPSLVKALRQATNSLKEITLKGR
jgi:hypothetical protein